MIMILSVGRAIVLTGDNVLSPAEEEAHLALWVLAKSPLIHGGDVRTFDVATLRLVTNPELLSARLHHAHAHQTATS